MAHLLRRQLPRQGGRLEGEALPVPTAQQGVDLRQHRGGELLRLQSRLHSREQLRLQQEEAEHPLLRPGGADVLIPQRPLLGLDLHRRGQLLPLLPLFGPPGPVFPEAVHLLGKGVP